MRILLVASPLFSLSCAVGLKTTISEPNDTAFLEPSLDPTAEPSNPTSEPAPTSQPSQPGQEPAAPTSEPASPTSEPAAPTTEPSTEPATFVISNVSPAFGSTSGGTIVTIMGGPFPANVSVDFSGISATLINSTSSSLQVQAPNFPGESTADITISSSQGSQTSYAAFTYFQDGSNLTGAVGVLYYLTDTGGYWGSASQSISGGWLTFVDPVDFHWWEFFTPAQDTCTGSSYSYGGQFGVYDFGQSGINLGSIYLPWDSTNYKFSSDNISIANNTTYSVTPFNTGLVGFTVNNIARTSQSPIVYAPAISGTTVPYISRYQTFTWSPSGADWIYIRLARLDPVTLNYVDEVNCIAQDDGSFTIEGSQWASWPIEEQIDIYFSRVVEQTSLLPHNNSYGRIVGEYTLLGAAFSQ